MGATTNYGFHYPDRGADPDAQFDMQQLAQDVDTQLQAEVAQLNAAIGGPSFQTWSPTIAGLPVSSVTARYARQGKLVVWRLDVIASGAATGPIQFTLPVQAVTGLAAVAVVGQAFAKDVSTGQYWNGAVILQDVTGPTSTAKAFFSASGTNTAMTQAAGSVPLPWASGDVLSVSGVVEASA